MKIEIDGTKDTFTFDGVQFSFAVLLAMTRPDSTKLYKFRRTEDGSNVIVTAYALHDVPVISVKEI